MRVVFGHCPTDQVPDFTSQFAALHAVFQNKLGCVHLADHIAPLGCIASWLVKSNGPVCPHPNLANHLLLRQPASDHLLRHSSLAIKLVAFGKVALIQVGKRSMHPGMMSFSLSGAICRLSSTAGFGPNHLCAWDWVYPNRRIGPYSFGRRSRIPATHRNGRYEWRPWIPGNRGSR